MIKFRNAELKKFENQTSSFKKKSTRGKHQKGKQAGSQHPWRVAFRRGVAYNLESALAPSSLYLSLIPLPPPLSTNHPVLSTSLFPPSHFSLPASPGYPGFPPWRRDDTRGLPNITDLPRRLKRGQLLFLGQRILSEHTQSPRGSTLSTGQPVTKGTFIEWTVPGSLTGNKKKKILSRKLIWRTWTTGGGQPHDFLRVFAIRRDLTRPSSSVRKRGVGIDPISNRRSLISALITDFHQEQCVIGIDSPYTVPVSCRLRVWRYMILCLYPSMTNL